MLEVVKLFYFEKKKEMQLKMMTFIPRSTYCSFSGQVFQSEISHYTLKDITVYSIVYVGQWKLPK